MDARVKAALEAVRRYGEDVLAQTPLAGIADWVRSGQPPAAEVLFAAGFGGPGRPDVEGRAPELNMASRAFTQAWGYSIPCKEAVEALCSLGPLVEIGAGTGYWSALLCAAGADVIATDAAAAGEQQYGFTVGRHCETEHLTAQQAVLRHPDRTVFCSWPTQGGKWALAAAWSMRPGQKLALISGSRTGTPGLSRYLRTRFDTIGVVDTPHFPLLDDRLTIHRKR